MHIPTRSNEPGQKSQPAEIRTGSADGLHRIYGGQRQNYGVQGLGCNDMTDIGYDGYDETPCMGISVDDPAVVGYGSVGMPMTTPGTTNRVGTAPAATQPGWNPLQAISSLNQTAAILQGGSVVQTPTGTAIYGNPATAGAAALANPSLGLSTNLSGMIMPVVLIGGLMLLMSSMKR